MGKVTECFFLALQPDGPPWVLCLAAVDPGADGVERGLCVLERRRTSRLGGVSGADYAQVRCLGPHPLRVCSARENT